MSWGGARDLPVAGDDASLGDILRAILAVLPAQNQIMDGSGRLRRDVRVFVGDRLIREAWGSEERVDDGSEVWLVPATSGG